MPETPAPAIEQRVRALVDQHQTELQQLVQVEVDRLLRDLVDAEVASRNGNGNGSRSDARTLIEEVPPHLPRRCRNCGETKSVTAFEKHRHTCRDCRRAQARERKAQTADTQEDPRPDGNGA